MYQTSVEACLIGQNANELQKSLHYLVYELYPTYSSSLDSSNSLSSLSSPSDALKRQQEFLAYYILHLVCFSTNNFSSNLTEFLQRLTPTQLRVSARKKY